MIVRIPKTLIAGLLAALAVATAGCGGGGKSGISSASGATLVRSGALVFVSADSDLGSSQWQQIDDLAHKFPGRDKALAMIKQALAKEKLDYDRDIKPALGPEVDLAVVTGATLKETSFAVLTKPDDAGKYKQLVAKLNASDDSEEPAVYREVNGWYVLSQSQQMIDRVLKSEGGESLAGDGVFNDALAKLPDEALAKAYVNGSKLATVIRQAAQENGTPFDPSSIGLDKLDFISASLSAEHDGVRVRGAVSGPGASALGSGDYASKVLGDAPGDALAFLTFRGGGTADRLQNLQSNPAIGPAIQQLQSTLGVSLADLLDLFRNEVALYIRPGSGIPEISLALETKDQDKALATLDKLAARLALFAGATVSSGEQGGHPVKTLDFGQFAVHYAGLGDKILITSGVNGIVDYGKGEKLPDSADFKAARSAAGLPDETGGFLYVDLKNAIPLIEGFAGFAGATPPAEVTENLRPLRSFLAWVAGSGDERTFDAFLEIK